jgi:hypothetical protein
MALETAARNQAKRVATPALGSVTKYASISARLGGDFVMDRTARLNGGSPGRALAQAGGMEWLPWITSSGSYSALTLRSRA